jgi:Ca-activated chloride channel homolog
MKLKSLAVILLTVMLLGCESGPPPAATKVAQAKPTSVEAKKVAPVAPQVWPFIASDEKEAPRLTTNLTEKNYVFVFDGSGSMGDTACGGGRPRVEPAKKAAKEWAKSVPADANIGLVAFHYGGWTRLKLSKDRKAFDAAVDKISSGGNTPLASAFRDAFEELTRQGQSQLGYGEYTIVTTTDGEADSIQALSKWVDYILQISPIQIYTIGFCIAENHTLNQPKKTTYRKADDLQSLKKGLQEVLAEAPDFDVSNFK